MRMIRLLICGLGLFLAAAFAADVTGKWAGDMPSPHPRSKRDNAATTAVEPVAPTEKLPTLITGRSRLRHAWQISPRINGLAYA